MPAQLFLIMAMLVGILLPIVVPAQERAEAAENVEAVLHDIVTDIEARDDLATSADVAGAFVAAVEARFGPDSDVTVGVMEHMAIVLYRQGDTTSAVGLQEETLRRRVRSLAENHPTVLTTKNNLAEMLRAQGDYLSARHLHESVVAARQRVLGQEHPDTLTSISNLAATIYAQGDYSAARNLHERAVEVRRKKLGADHPDTLTSIANLASVLQAQGDYSTAQSLLENVVNTRREKLGPQHPSSLTAMGNLAGVLYAQGDYEGARSLEEFVLATLQEKLGPEHPDTLIAAGNLAGTLRSQGDYEGARTLEESVVKIRRETIGAQHPDTVTAMANLAGTLRLQGDYEDARALEESVVETLREKLGARHPDTLTAMGNLAGTLQAQGDHEGARSLYEFVIESLKDMLGQEHPSTLTALSNLGSTLQAQGDYAAARSLFESILTARRERLGPEHPDTITTIANLGSILYLQGDYHAARTLEEEVVALRRKRLGPKHPDTLLAMNNLAITLYSINALDDSKRLFEQVLAIRGADDVLGTDKEFTAIGWLARVYRDLGKTKKAAVAYLRALDALEAQTTTIGGSEEIRQNYKASYEEAYNEALEAVLAAGQKEEAFHVVERFRAQSILRLLNEQTITHRELPADLEKRRSDLARRYDALIRYRDTLHPGRDNAELHRVLDQQKKVRAERDRLNVEIRARAPRIDGLQSPPLRAHDVQEILDPGTLLLSYKTGPQNTYLLTLAKDKDIAVHEISIDEITLSAQVRRFFSELNSPSSKTDASEATLASWLYEKLLGKVPGLAEQIAQSKRLLILPDGPLFYLPFAALLDENGIRLTEKTPISRVISATVFAQLQSRRQPAKGELTMAAYGDPIYSGRDRNVSVRGIFDGWLQDLPHSAREVVEIAKLFDTVPRLGADASEENVKTLGEEVDFVHFATHALTDPYDPLDSFIALSLSDNPERENGLLQAWEIYDSLRINADLVALSGCQTALGPENDGEGPMSLSRAFQVAGARTVLASLWNVPDESTAELMIRFYRSLLDANGRVRKTKAAALQEAQMEFINSPVTFTDVNGDVVTRDYSAPYYWSAFQVIGDYK